MPETYVKSGNLVICREADGTATAIRKVLIIASAKLVSEFKNES
jgi:hypothetical protein